jgi:putative ABC transport system permease protein
MSELWNDIRYSIRGLLSSPIYTIVIIITLAFGLGVNCAVFSLINAVFVSPLPYADEDRIVRIQSINPSANILSGEVSPADYFGWRSQSKSFDYMAAFLIGSTIIKTRDDAERVQAVDVTSDFFKVFGVNPMSGRLFLPEEHNPNSNSGVILSYNLWTRLFKADPNVIGTQISIQDTRVMIIGIMPKEFDYPEGTGIWNSAGLENNFPRGDRFLHVVAKIKNATSIKSAQSEIDYLSSRLMQEYPQTNQGWKADLTPLRKWKADTIRRLSLILFVASVSVWLITCANISSLTLVDSLKKRKSMALRAILGATRLHQIRLILTENLLLSVAGGVVGILLAKIIISIFINITPQEMLRFPLSLSNPTFLIYTLILSILTGVTCSSFSLINVLYIEPYREIKEGSLSMSGRIRSIRRGLFIGFEVALSLVLLISSGLLLKSFLHLVRADLGFTNRNMLTMRILVPNRRDSERINFFSTVVNKVKNYPGVQSVGMTFSLPIKGGGFYLKRRFIVHGSNSVNLDDAYANWQSIDPGYFETIGVKLIKGRFFNDYDQADTSPVIIINEITAQRYWPNEDPIGKQLTLLGAHKTSWPEETIPREIVGVVKNVKGGEAENDPEPEIYVPFAQKPQVAMTIIARVSGNPNQMIQAFREIVRGVDNNFPAYDFKTMEQILSVWQSRNRLITTLITLFAIISILLSAVGIYGLVSFLVTGRTKEIGVRIALGAQINDIRKQILKHEILFIFIGLVIGIVVSLSIGALLRAVLYEVRETDIIVFTIAPLFLFIVAFIACYIPIYRISKIPPLNALRYE